MAQKDVVADDEISMVQICPLDLLHWALCICCTLQPLPISMAQEEALADNETIMVELLGQICRLHALTACCNSTIPSLLSDPFQGSPGAISNPKKQSTMNPLWPLTLCMAQEEVVADDEIIMVHFFPAFTARTQRPSSLSCYFQGSPDVTITISKCKQNKKIPKSSTLLWHRRRPWRMTRSSWLELWCRSAPCIH